MGSQRSLAITTHLVLNGEIITQAPALKGAKIWASTPKAGSWELPVVIGMVGTAVWKVGTAPKDSVVGHLVRSAYDFVVSSVIGVHVDFEKTIGQQLDDMRSEGMNPPRLRTSQFDSAAEKCEVPIRDMHRPIVFSETASRARILGPTPSGLIARPLTVATYENIVHGAPAKRLTQIAGRVSSYNLNTFKGRIYLEGAGRPVAFEIDPDARTPTVIRAITRSLAFNARRAPTAQSEVRLVVRPRETRTGRLSQLTVHNVMSPEDDL